MAQIIYHNLDDAVPTTEWHGRAFTHLVPVEVDHEDPLNNGLIDAALHNRHFEVLGLPEPKELEELRSKHGGRPAKKEIEAAKNIETARTERDKKLEEADKARAEADKEVQLAISKAHRDYAGQAGASPATLGIPPDQASRDALAARAHADAAAAASKPGQPQAVSADAAERDRRNAASRGAQTDYPHGPHGAYQDDPSLSQEQNATNRKLHDERAVNAAQPAY